MGFDLGITHTTITVTFLVQVNGMHVSQNNLCCVVLPDKLFFKVYLLRALVSVVCYAGDPEPTGHVPSIHLVFPLRSWSLWLCLQPPQKELSETVHNGTELVLQCLLVLKPKEIVFFSS